MTKTAAEVDVADSRQGVVGAAQTVLLRPRTVINGIQQVAVAEKVEGSEKRGFIDGIQRVVAYDKEFGRFIYDESVQMRAVTERAFFDFQNGRRDTDIRQHLPLLCFKRIALDPDNGLFVVRRRNIERRYLSVKIANIITVSVSRL